MPIPMLRSMAQLLPRLDAEDMLRAIRSFALGSGLMKDGKQQIASITRTASDSDGPQRASSAEVAAFVQNAGVRVKKA